MEKSMRTLLLAIALAANSFSSFANDSERINQLESQVLELKQRLQKLESLQQNPSSQQKPITSTQGWKSLANWRGLKNGMSYNNVRGLLGEPERIDGGTIALWNYPNFGNVTFTFDKVTGWREPQ